jgi:hypothetical protein
MLPDIQRRIVNAKYILERAARIQSEGNEMSLSVSLLLMHDAVELLMLAVLDHLKLKKKFEFMNFWSTIKDAGHAEPPDSIPMESLNKLRVGLKHNGILPRPQTVQELLPRVRGFFENILKAYCGLDYASVSLIDLVPDQDVRALLHDAQAKFASGDKAGALTNLKVALHDVENPKGKYVPFLHAPDKPRIPNEMARAGWEQYLSQLHAFLGESASRMNAAMIGVDPTRYAALRRNTPNVQWSVSGKQTVVMTETYQRISEQDFSGMLDFLIEYALNVSEISISKAPGSGSFQQGVSKTE